MGGRPVRRRVEYGIGGRRVIAVSLEEPTGREKNRGLVPRIEINAGKGFGYRPSLAVEEAAAMVKMWRRLERKFGAIKPGGKPAEHRIAHPKLGNMIALFEPRTKRILQIQQGPEFGWILNREWADSIARVLEDYPYALGLRQRPILREISSRIRSRLRRRG